MHADRGYDRGSARIRLIEPGCVDRRIGRANAERDLAVAERVGREKRRDRTDAIDFATERRLCHLETRRAHAKLTGDRRAICVASGGGHPEIEGVAFCVHREGNVRLTANRVDPRTEAVEDPSRFSVAERLGHGGVDVGRDPELGVGGLPSP